MLLLSCPSLISCTHTHTPPTHPGYPMVDSPYPCSCGPILNMFSNYLQSPGHNRKPWASKVGGVAMFCLLIYMCVSSFAGYYKLTNASNVIACNQEPYREPPNTGCQVNILTLQGKSRIQNAQLYTCDAQLWCTLITNSLHPGTIYVCSSLPPKLKMPFKCNTVRIRLAPIEICWAHQENKNCPWLHECQ